MDGVVLELDATPMFVDGDGELTVRSEALGRVELRIPARESLCPASGLGGFLELEPGDRVRIRGRVSADGRVRVCADSTHILERLGREP